MEFREKIAKTINAPLTAQDIRVLQVNIGYRCNMSCLHCHINAGPAKTETMEKRAMDSIIAVLLNNRVGTVDITGGSPEMNPNFRFLVQKSLEIGCRVIVRTNLTIFHEKGLEWVSGFYRDHDIEISASLPFYLEDDVDRVRGRGTFSKSLAAIRELNSFGYGKEGTGRQLNLICNPAGAVPVPSQDLLESEFRKGLFDGFGIAFTNLYALSNMPIGRFRDYLVRSGLYEGYQNRLRCSFNPETLNSLMCRQMINVGWNGLLYDCDFNQALGLRVESGLPGHIGDFNYKVLRNRTINVGNHCYGCTAAQGFT